MGECKEKIKFPFLCPVCGKSEFDDVDWILDEEQDMEVYEIDPITGQKRILDAIEAHNVHCEYCGWMYDLKQVLDHDVVGDRNGKSVNDLKSDYQKIIQENPNYHYDNENSKPIPHRCPVCCEYEFADIDSYDVCSVCGWIDDGTESVSFNEYSDANNKTICDAIAEFKKQRLINPNYKWKNTNK